MFKKNSILSTITGCSQARLVQYQHPGYGTVLPPSSGTNPANMMTNGSANGNEQQQDQGWRLPQYRPMLRKEDQPGARREPGLPWTSGPAPQIGQDRWLPPSHHHQVELKNLIVGQAKMVLLLFDKLPCRLVATGQGGRRG